ncbi:LrgB family protein [Acinetobacter sp. CFCC 10889]|uniref:LrgB family protein n=1 Tax=Acinetobacter sp. CFCC 10889 TaxID=1775557 RepID=UPI000DD0A265|nr:LrgB family protein [Acinetobacter sp. CFCC 10889]
MNIWSIFFLIITIIGYFCAKTFFLKTQKIYFSPIITVPILCIILIYLSNKNFIDYYHYTQFLVWMLAPITISFAVPVFHYREMICKNFKVLILSSCISMSIGMLSSWYLASIFQLDSIVKNSLFARSISIPFALILTEKINASVSLIPLFTVITGLVGMLFGDLILQLCSSGHNKIANGTALGNGAHAMGVARAKQRHAEEGVIASLAMIISGIMMVFIGPIVFKLL